METSGYPEAVLADDPALYLATDGSIVDAVAGAALTVSRAATYATAPSGQGLVKTGATGAAYVSLTTPITGAVLTLEIWGRYNGSTYYQDAFACTTNDHLMLVNAGSLYLGMWVAGYKGPSVARPTDNAWHHFVHVITSASVNGVSDGLCEQYIDGVYAGSFAHPLDTKTRGVARIADWSGGYPFGDWADPAVYTHALTAERIATHYALGLAEDFTGSGTTAITLAGTGDASVAVSGGGSSALVLASSGAGKRGNYEYSAGGWGQPIPSPSSWQVSGDVGWASSTEQDGWS